MSHYTHSKIPRRSRSVPVEYGEMWGSIFKSTTTRMTEVYAGEREEFGELIAATNNKTYDPETLTCSCCGQRKHKTLFNRDARYTWRQSRRYECQQCQKLQGVDQKARRAKRLARQKTA